ncbi:MAG: ATP-binding protein [Bacteroidota bacterium]|jgi:PAS domain S-box-containing protein|nr:ATP-binding protein [Bacteroidota bacterium]
MQRTRTLSSRSRLLVLGLAVLAVAVTFFVWFEVTQSREELLRFVEAEAAVLIATVNRGSETTIAANAELERALVHRLRLAARVIDRETTLFASTRFDAVARDLDVDRIQIIDGAGRITAGTDIVASVSSSPPDTSEVFADVVRPVLDGRYSWLAQGGVRLADNEQELFILVHERHRAPGAVLVGISSTAMLDMRLRLGIGTLLRDIGATSALAFVVLQDDHGILTASEGIREMRAIADDPFLRDALDDDRTHSRIRDHAGVPVFEVVKRLHRGEEPPALMRIGLSLDLVRDIQQRSMHRVIFIAVGFFITAAILLILLYTRQRYGALRQEHRRIRGYTDLVLDNINDAVVATDAVGTVTVLNQAAARMLGLSDGDGVGRRCGDLCPGDVFLLRHTRESAAAVPYAETSLTRPSGETRMLAVSTSVIRDEAGAVETLVAIARDMTEQQRIREQLQRKDRVTAMGELAGGIAHEIRNPLNAISIIAQRFQHEFTPADGADEYAELTRTIRSEVQRVNSIITQFLEFARPPRLVPRPCELIPLITESLALVRSQAAARQVQMPLIADAELVISADREKLLQALLNIYQNALEALPDAGIIKTVACRSGDRVSVSIADNGPGMPEEVRRKIFNLYFTTKSTGTGLGLSIVHQIISEHGGEIRVASNEHGGTTFQILLPLAPPTAATGKS